MKNPSNLDVVVVPELPPLAWLLAAEQGRNTLFCGTGVETGEDWFFEGCWAGPFEERGFDRAADVFGSGARVGPDGRLLFVPASHENEPLYILLRDGAHLVSNSLAFAVEFAGIDLPYDPGIGLRFATLLKGLGRYERQVFAGEGWRLCRVIHENFEVVDGELRLWRKPDAIGFADFAAYRARIAEAVGKAFENGASMRRRLRFEPIVTCSSGYDTPAAAAIAAELGCREGVTMHTARGGDDDSGKAIIERLGMRAAEYERPPARSERFRYAEAEFVSAGMGGDDYFAGIFEDRLAGRIMMTGHGGGRFSPHARPSPDLPRQDSSGMSLVEFRLRLAFVHIPLACIAMVHHPDVVAISRNAEMAPYRLGTGYDKPIPRRLAEEAGVPREWFGQKKKAGAILLFEGPEEWTRRSLADLDRFEREILSGPAERRRHEAAILRHRLRLAALHSGNRWAAKAANGTQATMPGAARIFHGIGHRGERLFAQHEHGHPRFSATAVLWAIDKMRARYAPAREAARRGGAAHAASSRRPATGPAPVRGVGGAG